MKKLPRLNENKNNVNEHLVGTSAYKAKASRDTADEDERFWKLSDSIKAWLKKHPNATEEDIKQELMKRGEPNADGLSELAYEFKNNLVPDTPVSEDYLKNLPLAGGKLEGKRPVLKGLDQFIIPNFWSESPTGSYVPSDPQY